MFREVFDKGISCIGGQKYRQDLAYIHIYISRGLLVGHESFILPPVIAESDPARIPSFHFLVEGALGGTEKIWGNHK